MDAGESGGVMWRYDEYSEWGRSLARTHTVADLLAQLAKALKKKDAAKTSHLRAIQATSSMAGQSQRRASSRTTLTTLYAQCCALEDALQIHRLFPEMSRQS